MAQFGAKRPIFAPTKTTPDNALPTYDYEKVVTVGKLVKADLTVTNASGELYADDALAEKVDMFASGSLALETDDKTDEVHAAIHGATKDTQSSEVTDSDGDVAPRGGLCYYKVIIRGGVRYFKGVFHPLVKAILGNDSAATKGSSITFGTSCDDLYRVPLQLWRMAHHERVHDGKRVYRVVRYQARQSGRLISARTGGERERLASRFGNWRVKA